MNMPVKPNFNPDYLYFVTTTTIRHIHLFERDSIKRILVDSFHFFRTEQRMNLYIFVIMPNHIHFIARFSVEHEIGAVLRDFKRHTARQIIRQLSAEQDTRALTTLEKVVTDRRQKYKVWEEGYDARDIFSVGFLQQKMDYSHWNPCQPKWRSVKVPEDYPWSSARFYLADQPGIIPIDDVRDLFI